MYLQLVNSTQARRLRKLGFNWKVHDIFINMSTRRYMEETMEAEENWNRFDDTMSRPSIPLALHWLRIKFNGKCEVEIKPWNKESYHGTFLFPEMAQPVSTKTYKHRNSAENDLLSTILVYLIQNTDIE